MNTDVDNQFPIDRFRKPSLILGWLSLVSGTAPALLAFWAEWNKFWGEGVYLEEIMKINTALIAFFALSIIAVIAGGFCLYLESRKISISAGLTLIVIILTSLIPVMPITTVRHIGNFDSLICLFLIAIFVIVLKLASKKRWRAILAIGGIAFAFIDATVLLNYFWMERMSRLWHV